MKERCHRKKVVTINEPTKPKLKLKPYPDEVMDDETIEQSLDGHYANWKIGTKYERQKTMRKGA